MTTKATVQSETTNGIKETKSVYQLIATVAGELSHIGISKTQRNQQGAGYNFRGIDDVYNAVGPLLAKHGLVILPRCIKRELVERLSAQGKALFYVTVDAEFDFVSSEDNSVHTVKMYGEAMDSGDKATNKAMSAAYKYAMFQAFCIPTAGDNDADASTHEVIAKPESVETLSANQVDEITKVANEVGAEVGAITNFYNVKTLNDVPAAAMPAIMRSLDKKRNDKEPTQ